MFLLILVLLVPTGPMPRPIVVRAYQTIDECAAAASQADHVGPLEGPRDPRVHHLCFRLVYPT